MKLCGDINPPLPLQFCCLAQSLLLELGEPSKNSQPNYVGWVRTRVYVYYINCTASDMGEGLGTEASSLLQCFHSLVYSLLIAYIILSTWWGVVLF